MSSIKRAADLEEFSAFIAERTGLYFPREKFQDLELAVSRAAPELGFTDAAACINSLVTSPPDKELLETLAAYLTIGETYFFRNKADFDAIRNIVLPALTGDGKREQTLRIWSAGCATGEEPYSLAMLLDSCSPALRSRAVSILATDINSKALREAGRGIYGDWSFREVPEQIKATYFTKTRDKKLHLLPRIRGMVDFSYLNLAEDSYPSLLTATNAMDLILCRNVLMYFRADLAEAVLRKFRAALKDGGWLILGPAEGPLTFSDKIPGLEPARLPGLTIYRKAAGPRPQPPALYAAAAPSRTTAARTRPPAPPAPKKRPLEEAGGLYRAGLYTEAGKELEALLAAEPQNAAGLVLLARVRANLGRLAEAGKLCAEAIEADKLDPLAHYLLGTIFLEEGRDSEAGMSFRKALYLAPDHILTHLALGNLFLRGGKAAWARRHFKSAAALLKRHEQQDVLPDSEGMTAGRLEEIVRSALTRFTDD
ncbi:MAG: hypothetical protein A2X35_02590 [Elusimicrobia bacterium GWA2_61_42]|nr:MAG: hypothetical protein A2X35_02590 [Elusimicrobia bacterium GWA2_61_42]